MLKILYISGTRADFGLMKECLMSIHHHPKLSVDVVVTGMHLLAEYGNTWEEIAQSGLTIVEKIPVTLSGNSNNEMSCALGETLTGLSHTFERKKPDLILLLGDRGEMLAGAISAVHLNIPIVHIHGGERSGTIDESIRHAISKFAHYHLVATHGSRERLIRMGEQANNIHVTGAPGLDSIKKLKIKDRDVLFIDYQLKSCDALFLVLFHPVVQQSSSLADQMNNLLTVIQELNAQTLILMPNADTGGKELRKAIYRFQSNKYFKIATHIPRDDFLSLVSYSEVLVGNSSCGIIEAASLGTPVLNIGSRQKLRERSANVVDSGVTQRDIKLGLEKALSLRGNLFKNVYGQGDTTGNIIHFLENLNIDAKVLEKVNAY